MLVDKVKRNHTISRHICVDHCVLLLQHLSTNMHFIAKLFKDQLNRSKAACSFMFLISLGTSPKLGPVLTLFEVDPRLLMVQRLIFYVEVIFYFFIYFYLQASRD